MQLERRQPNVGSMVKSECEKHNRIPFSCSRCCMRDVLLRIDSSGDVRSNHSRDWLH